VAKIYVFILPHPRVMSLKHTQKLTTTCSVSLNQGGQRKITKHYSVLAN